MMSPYLTIPLFGLCGVSVIYFTLTPISPAAENVSADVLYCLVFAGVLRAPSATPLVLIAILGLLADILLTRPLGLGAFVLVVVSEIARRNRFGFRTRPFLFEWITAIGLFAIGFAAIHTILRLSFSPAPTIEAAATHIFETALFYPVIAACLALIKRMFRSPTLARRNEGAFS